MNCGCTKCGYRDGGSSYEVGPPYCLVRVLAAFVVQSFILEEDALCNWIQQVIFCSCLNLASLFG